MRREPTTEIAASILLFILIQFTYEMLESFTISFVLVLTRVTAFIGFFPLFGRQQVPGMVKAGLATALAAFWIGSSPDNPDHANLTLFTFVMLIVKEAGIGILLATMLSFILIPARIAGTYVGQEIGISMEPVTNSGNEQSTIMTSIFEAISILLFFGLNLHHFLILMLHHSFNQLTERINLFELPTEGLVQLIDRLTASGLSIIGPIGLLSFVILIGLFLLTKAAPSLNLFSVGMPLRTGLGLLLLIMLVPTIWASIETYFLLMLEEVESFMNSFWQSESGNETDSGGFVSSRDGK